MRTDPLSPLAFAYSGFRVLVVLLGLLAAWRLFRRPRAEAALVVILLQHLAAWAAYVAPLGRLYGLEEHLDVSFNVGIASAVAAGNNPWDHTQVRFANLEPFWSVVVAVLALFRPQNVIPVFQALIPLSIVVVALGVYLGLKGDDSEEDRWERTLLVFAALGLSSFSLSQRPPIPALWPANFLLKPNHAMAWGMLAVTIGLWARGAAAPRLGLALGLLAWMFLLDWAYLLVGLALGLVLERAPRPGWTRAAAAVAVSLAVIAPDLANLLRDYDPTGRGASTKQIWFDSMGFRLAAPHWATLDLGVLLVLGLLGLVVWRQRARPLDRTLFAVVAAAWLLWLGYQAGVPFGFSPEPDEHHYYLRFVMALAAGAALAWGGRFLESVRQWPTGRGHALVMGAVLPLTFPAYWDPPSMDRYFPWSIPPLHRKTIEYGEWVRENTPRDAVFLAGRSACIWIPVLAGRRVLHASDSRPPKDLVARLQAERVLVTSRSEDEIRRTAAAFGVTHVAVDHEMEQQYGRDVLQEMGRLPVYERVYATSAVRIYRVR